jgi:hypothetical protein
MSDDQTSQEDLERIEPEEHYITYCDFCYDSELEDSHITGLRPMYRLDDGCVICQKCVDKKVMEKM